MTDLHSLVWPASNLAEAVTQLARHSHLLPTTAEPKSINTDALRQTARQTFADREALGRWIEFLTVQLGIEAEPVQTIYTDLQQLVQNAGPALLVLPDKAEDFGEVKELHLLLLLRSNKRQAMLLGPDHALHRIPVATICGALCEPIDGATRAWINPLLAELGVARHRQLRAQAAIINELVGGAPIEVGWLLRLSPSAAFDQQWRQFGLHRQGLRLLAGYLIYQGLQIGAWSLIGRGALSGRFDWGWLLAWALILLTSLPFQLWADDAQKKALTTMAALLKQRLLYGVLRLAPEEIRHLGTGQFLGQVLEAQAVEQLALMGGFVTVLALIQLFTAGVVLALGNGGWWWGLLLLAWLLGAGALGWRYFRRSEAWIAAYRAMTHDLVERMVGHRTRLAQAERAHWHDDEDQLLNRYLRLSNRVDQAWTPLSALVTRGWLFSGFIGLGYSLVFTHASLAQLAIRLGGILLAQQAFSQLVAGGQSISGALLAWRQVRPLVQAALQPEAAPDHAALNLLTPAQATGMTTMGGNAVGRSLILAREINFRYPKQGRAVLQNCNLQIRHGDRLLLAGPSGGGKSTLTALLAGLRIPESGLLLLWGFDRQTLGPMIWRRRVVAAPQFHENHVLTETFAFNLLMGRRWPPTATDLADAEEICHELGLGELLSRMPAGMQQMVGESGWRLSHGERSRIYIARALLQQADLLILDESFAALDPENLQLALACVLRRAPTLLVVAHP
ncbi:MAG: ATP-binding cassette domain-containing protein [Caldilineaceae bacterium]